MATPTPLLPAEVSPVVLPSALTRSSFEDPAWIACCPALASVTAPLAGATYASVVVSKRAKAIVPATSTEPPAVFALFCVVVFGLAPFAVAPPALDFAADVMSVVASESMFTVAAVNAVGLALSI